MRACMCAYVRANVRASVCKRFIFAPMYSGKRKLMVFVLLVVSITVTNMTESGKETMESLLSRLTSSK